MCNYSEVYKEESCLQLQNNLIPYDAFQTKIVATDELLLHALFWPKTSFTYCITLPVQAKIL
jgi:hypothetical protein